MARSRVLQRPGVLTPQVDVAPLAAGGPAGDGHGLEHGEGVTLQEDPVLERARLGLVGVAHQVVGPDGLGRHRRPLPPGREGRSAPADELGVGHLPDHPCRAQGEGLAQRPVAAVGPVVVQADGIHHPDPAQEDELRIAQLGNGGRHRRFVRRRGAAEGFSHGSSRRRGEHGLLPLLAVVHHQGRRSPLAQSQAGALLPHGVGAPDPVGEAPCAGRPATTSPEPAIRQARSTHTCTTRGGRGSMEKSP